MIYRDDFREGERQFYWTLPRIAIGLLVATTLLGGAGWVASIVSQPARVLSKTFDADNMINNYEWFHDANGNYLARSAQVKQFKTLLGAETDSQEKGRLRIEMAAIQQGCRDIARRYNANAEKANRAIFMRGVPETLNAGECE